MNNREIKAMLAELSPVIREFVVTAAAASLARIDALEKRVDNLPAPQHGRDGRDADPDAIAAQVRADLEPVISALGESVAALVIPEVPDVASMIAEAIAALPAPTPGEPGKRGEKGEPGSTGRDGVGLAGAIVDRDGNLVVTLSNGEAKSLGPVCGKDGLSGLNGRDGTDGLGFEDMSEEWADDGRTIIRRYTRGDQVKEFRHTLPVVIDRGVYQEGKTYEQGDGVTWGGSFWIAQQKTTAKPDGGDGWRLSVKRGRDGKSAPAPAETKGPIRVGVPAMGKTNG